MLSEYLITPIACSTPTLHGCNFEGRGAGDRGWVIADQQNHQLTLRSIGVVYLLYYNTSFFPLKVTYITL